MPFCHAGDRALDLAEIHPARAAIHGAVGIVRIELLGDFEMLARLLEFAAPEMAPGEADMRVRIGIV